MKIAYFSPLSPLKSGIADYSEELLPHLAKSMDIDLYVDGYTPSNKKIISQFKVRKLTEYPSVAQAHPYDANLYHIGNHTHHEHLYRHALQYPGIVVLHDLSLHNLIAAMTLDRKKPEEYLMEMEYAHNELGRATAQAYIDGAIPPPWVSSALEYPLNKQIIESARGLIVHSYFSRNRVKSVRPDVPVKKINHHAVGIDLHQEENYAQARKILKLSPQEIMIASFGFANPDKQIDKILTAIARLIEEGHQFKYYIVGEVAPELKLKELIRRLGIPKEAVVVTGYLGLDEFIRYMSACDIGLNLRAQVRGETSGNLHRMLGMGKPVLVSNAGSFCEYPNEILIKTNVGEAAEESIYRNLKELLDNESRRKELGRAAFQFAQEHLSVEQSARDYSMFISNVVNNRYKYEILIEQLADEINKIMPGGENILLKAISQSLVDLC